MAKIHLTTTQQNQEDNLSVSLASLGILICMIVSVVGIKLWWFKHRLSFEQKNSATSSANRVGTSTAAVLVPRRNKQPKYKKDKRYSQQIYESVQIHGVFRQKLEDEFEIKRPEQLPPVRIRQASEGDSVPPIRPPPRTKRRDQIHSTAFEDLEIATTANLAAASSSDLSVIPEINTNITLTFEEFERQFNLNEIKAANRNNEISEISISPLRLNRSSSAMTKHETPNYMLKSSQSITTLPEFHKVIEKRSVKLASPKEDLSRIDLYEENVKIFNNLAVSKTAPTGYIRYEEVDNDLHERVHNSEMDQEEYNLVDSGFNRSYLKVKKHKQSIHNKNSNESLSVYAKHDNINFNRNSSPPNEVEEEDFKEEKLLAKGNNSHNTQVKNSEQNSEYGSDKIKDTKEFKNDVANYERNSILETTTDTNANHFVYNTRANEYTKDCHNQEERLTITVTGKVYKTEKQNSVENNSFNDFNEPPFSEKYVAKNRTVKDKKSHETFIKTGPNESSANFDKEEEEEEELGKEFVNWPQFEEKIETPQVTVRRFNTCHLESQNSFNETDDVAIAAANYSYKHTIDNDNIEPVVTLKESRPTGYTKYRSESPEFKDIEERQESFNNKFYNQVRTLVTAEQRNSSQGGQVSFNSAALQRIENKHNKMSALKQRRPTGYIKPNELFVTLNYDSDEDTYDGSNTNSSQLAKVKFEDNNDFSSEQETEKFTLNQRRPTGFARLSNSQLRFDETTIFHEAKGNGDSLIKQRRPTGFITKLELLHISDNETTGEDDIKMYDNRNEGASQNSPATVRFHEMETDFDTTAATRVKQRRPTNYVKQVIASDSAAAQSHVIDIDLGNSASRTKALARQEHFLDSPTAISLETEKYYKVEQRSLNTYGQQEELLAGEKQVSFQLNSADNETSYAQQNEALQQRRPTGFIRKEDVNKHVDFQLKEEKTEYGNEQLEQRRPAGCIGSSKELKCLDQPAPIYQPTATANADDSDGDNYQHVIDHLWQELEKDVAQDVSHNIEEEFAKIRHSYELNEADFLELKDELQKSATGLTQQPLGYGKSIEDDWENFEKLKSQVIVQPSPVAEEKIKITFSDDNELSNTTSILKDAKLEEDMHTKPRKSKVTFDFKTNEHIIPARETSNRSEEDTDFECHDDNVYNKPPQPVKRATNINYNDDAILTPIVATPMSITLFGSQISTADTESEDGCWSAIRKHRNVTSQIQHFSTDSNSPLQSQQATSSLNVPPKPTYRNPLAQLAIQRAKEVRNDMAGFKSRSINDRKPETSSKQKPKLYNLSNNDHELGTEA